jgi:hypothetical protein
MSKMMIYVIYYNEMEDTNVFTTNLSLVEEIIQQLAIETDTEITEWKYRVIIE